MDPAADAQIGDWSSRLAREVDETLGTAEEPLAPLIAEAFLEGGASREELFRPAEGTVGAFGAGGMVALLPTLLQSLVLAAPALIALMASDGISRALILVNNGISLALIGKRGGQLLAPEAGEQPEPRTVSNLSERDLESIRQVTALVERELRRCRIAEEKCELISLRVLKALLEDPAGTTAFLNGASGRT